MADDEPVKKFPPITTTTAGDYSDGDDEGGESETSMPMMNDQSNTSCDQTSLLPRKRSQATKSPIPPEALAAATAAAVVAATAAAADDVGGGDDGVMSMAKPSTASAAEVGTCQFGMGEEGGGGGGRDDLLMNNSSRSETAVGCMTTNNLTEARTSLNASFDAAAVATTTEGKGNSRLAASFTSASAMKSNPKYTSPKRRKQSFDGKEALYQQQQSLQITEKNMSGAQVVVAQKPPPPPPSSFTPLRPPRTQQKQQRHRNKQNTMDDGAYLFSPKPVYYSGEKKIGSGGSGSASVLRPPRPSSGSGGSGGNSSTGNTGSGGGIMATTHPSSPLSPSPKSINSSTGTTPFRFHAFPASLPRVVNPRGGAAFVGTNSQLLDAAAVDITSGSGGNDTTATPRLSLRPKPIAAASTATSAAHLPASKQHHPPPSPASRRLFMQNNNPSFEDNTASTNNNDISGDWSEATSKSFTNERIRMSNVPTHVATTAAAAASSSILNDLEEEEDVDTVIMNEDDDSACLDDEMSENKLLKYEEDKKSKSSEDCDENDDDEELNLGGTKLNFNMSEESSAGKNSGRGKKKVSDPPPQQQQLKRSSSSVLLESTMHPHTPRGYLMASPAAATASAVGEQQQQHQFHIHNLEVSPIVRLPDDYEDNEDHDMMDDPTGECSIPMKGSIDDNDDIIINEPSDLVQPLFRDDVASPILANKSSENASSAGLFHPLSSMMDTTSSCANNSASSTSVRSAVNTTTSTINANNTTALLNNSNITSTTNPHRPTARKVLRRPMPDTSAFDLGGGGTPSQHNGSLGSMDNNSGFHSHKTAGTSSDRLLCPPTPIRTPAWAHTNDPGTAMNIGGVAVLKRANSLISTKVLAACPNPRLLDNLSSLEDSMLENDISGYSSALDSTAEGTAEGSLHNNNPVLLSSSCSLFAPVEEEEKEEDNGMFRSLEDHQHGTERMLSPKTPSTTATISNSIPTRHQPMVNDTAGPSSPTATAAAETGGDDVISFSSDFDNLGILGSGAFADVYKVRSKQDRRLYAIKRTRRQFRGVKDRERAMAEVHTMKRLQNALLSEVAQQQQQQQASHSKGGHASEGSGGTGSGGGHHHHSKSNYGLYLLFFIRAWQQDGFFYCQTELCSRATCRHLRLSLSSEWERDFIRYPSLQLCLMKKATSTHSPSSPAEEVGGTAVLQQQQQQQQQDLCLIPERAIWQMCHDISRGLFHIHSYNMVHYDIKPSNIFFVFNSKWGTICKIGDFGLAGDIGTKDDGQEGDTAYMPNELLTSSCAKHPGADIFSLGLALYELAAASPTSTWSLPREGDRWHELRNGVHRPELPGRSANLVELIMAMIRPNVEDRPTAEEISELEDVKRANALSDSFLSQYVNDMERYDSRREREMESAEEEARRRSSTPIASLFNHHALGSDTVIRRARDLRTPTNNEDELPLFR